MGSRKIGSAWFPSVLLSITVLLGIGCETDQERQKQLELAPGHRDYCEETLCKSGEGDCEQYQCAPGLVCGTDNGARFGYSASTDVCVAVTCDNGVQDMDELGIDCGGSCGHCMRPEGAILGSRHFCSEMFPCSYGQADCDNDGQCDAGLVCGENNGPRFGYRPLTDVCVPSNCENGILDVDEDEVDCGGMCGSCVRPNELIAGTVDYCSAVFPCSVGEGDCDGDNQCTGSLVCGENNGPTFGLPKGYDVCEEPPDTGEAKLGAEVIYDFLDRGKRDIADQMLEDCWQLPRYDSVCFGGEPEWQEDPYDEKYWRFIFYALRPLRHLLWAYQTTTDVRYRDQLVRILRSFAQKASDIPASYRWDRHTTAFRAMSLVNIVQKLRSSDDLDDSLDAALVELIHEDGVFLENPKNFEATNNHGITQAAALVLIAYNFPEFAEAERWRWTGIDRLNTLVSSLIDADGVEIEQSPFYHFYVLMMLLQIHDWVEEQGLELTTLFAERVAQMVRYATLIAAPDGLVPMLGSTVRQSIRTYQRSVFDKLQSENDEFLYVRSAGRRGVSPQDRVVLFPSTGQAILRSGFGPAEEFEQQTHLLFYIGRHRTNHSHLDALNFHLYNGGRTILTDSGLFTYEKGLEHDYYWSTRAHNTVVVDGLNQRKGTAAIGLTVEEEGWAYQSGSHTLYDGVFHGRGIVLIGRDIVVVVDYLDSDTVHEYAQTWHLFPGARADGSASAVQVDDENGQSVLSIHQSEADNLDVSFPIGETSPRQGWYSEIYEVERPGQVIEYRRNATSAMFATVFALGSLSTQTPHVTLTNTNSDASVQFTLDETAYSVQIQDLAGPREQVIVVSEPAN